MAGRVSLILGFLSLIMVLLTIVCHDIAESFRQAELLALTPVWLSLAVIFGTLAIITTKVVLFRPRKLGAITTVKSTVTASIGLLTGALGIITAIAILLFGLPERSHHPSSAFCINNLHQLDGAKEQWALEHKKADSDMPTMEDLVGTDKFIKITPFCNGGGKYILNNMTTKPRCTIIDHTLR